MFLTNNHVVFTFLFNIIIIYFFKPILSGTNFSIQTILICDIFSKSNMTIIHVILITHIVSKIYFNFELTIFFTKTLYVAGIL